MKTNRVAVFAAAYFLAPSGSPQPGMQGTSTPAFEVVSVKPSGTNSVRILANSGAVRLPVRGFQYTPGRLTCNLALRSIVREAYSLKAWQVSGPSWIDTDTFEVAATMPKDTTKDRAKLMLRTMLVQRFGLGFHPEHREFPVYALLRGKTAFRLPEVPEPEHWNQRSSPGRFMATAMPIDKFADFLTGIADRPVVDMTGIKGAYQFDLTWQPDYQDQPGLAHPADAGIFEAVRQIGLRLEAQRAPFDLLLIDHVSRVPTEN